MTTAVALLRVSTPDQLLGLEAQRADIDRFAAAHGLTVLSWHTEVVSGGAVFEYRTGLIAALDDVASLRAGHLLVAKRDRLARDPLVALMVERTLKSVKASLLCADGNNELDLHAELMRGILDVFARYERRIIGLRTKAALAAIKASGRKLGRPVGVVEKGPRKRRVAA